MNNTTKKVDDMAGLSSHHDVKCIVVQKNSSMFEFAASLLPTNVGQPMHSPSALTEHVSLNLA